MATDVGALADAGAWVEAFAAGWVPEDMAQRETLRAQVRALLAERDALREAARAFLDEWDAGDGADADTCDAAEALRALLIEEG